MTPQAIEQLKNDLRPAFERHEVRLAYLFGSQATGQTHSQSDTDVAVLLPPELDPLQRHEVRMELIGALMDACRSDAVDLALLNGANPVFRREVVKDGILLFGSRRTAITFANDTQREFEATASERKAHRAAVRARVAERIALRQSSAAR